MNERQLNIILKIVKKSENKPIEKMDKLIRLTQVFLHVQLYLAKIALKKEQSNFPQTLQKLSEKKQFFDKLSELVSFFVAEHTDLFRKQYRRKPIPDEIPRYNMCGYTATAIAEYFKTQGLEARVVYGHFSFEETTLHHYWTEVVIEENKYFIDATYSQFFSFFKNQILVYPINYLSIFGLKEFKRTDTPLFGDIEIATLDCLHENNGLLPIRMHMNNDKQKIKIFNEMVNSLEKSN